MSEWGKDVGNVTKKGMNSHKDANNRDFAEHLKHCCALKNDETYQ